LVSKKPGMPLVSVVHDETASAMPVKKKFRESQGVIHGKRCGTSQNLGPTARLRSLILQAQTA